MTEHCEQGTCRIAEIVTRRQEIAEAYAIIKLWWDAGDRQTFVLNGLLSARSEGAQLDTAIDEQKCGICKADTQFPPLT